MGGFDVGGLYGSLNLNISNYTGPAKEAEEITRRLQAVLASAGTNAALMAAELVKAGISQEDISAGLNRYIGTSETATAALQNYIRALIQAQGASAALTNTPDKRVAFANEYANAEYRAAQIVAQFNNSKATSEKRYADERVGLANKIADAEKRLADLKAKDTAQYERDFKAYADDVIRLNNLIATGEKRTADEKIAMINRIAAATQRNAQEEIALNNRIARAEADRVAALGKSLQGILDKDKADIQARIDLNNQMAQGAAQAAAIEKAGIAATDRATRELTNAERIRFEQHRRYGQLASSLETIGATVAAGGGVALGGELLATHKAAEFQDSMAKSLSIIGTVSDALRNELAASARLAAKDTGILATDLAENFAVMAKGGMTATSSVRDIGTFAKFAVATNSELHESTRQVLTVMESLRLGEGDLKRVTSELTVANQLNRGSVDQLATALEGKAGAAFRSSKATLEQALAVVVAFSRVNIEGATAQTAAAQVLNRLTDAVRTHGNVLLNVNGTQTKFHDLMFDETHNTRSYIAVISDLNAAMHGLSIEQVNAKFAEMGLNGVKALNSIKPLLGQAGILGQLEEVFKKAASSGADDKAFADRMQSFTKQLELLKRKADDLMISLGLPLIAVFEGLLKAAEPFLSLVASLVQHFSELPQWVQSTVGALALIGTTMTVGAGGALLFAGHTLQLFANLRLLVGSDLFAKIIEGVAGISNGLVALGVSAATVLGPILGVVAAGLALAALTQKFVVTPKDKEISGRYADHARLMDENFDPSLAAKEKGKKLGEGLQAGITPSIDSIRKELDEALKKITEGIGSGHPVTTVSAKETAAFIQQEFNNLGIIDYATAIEGRKKELADLMTRGLLSPEQIASARENIQRLIDARDLLGKAFTGGLGAKNQFGTNVLALQFKEIKDEAQDALNTAVKLEVQTHKGLIGKVNTDIETVGELQSAKLELVTKDLIFGSDAWENYTAKVSDALARLKQAGITSGQIGGGGPDSEIKRIEAFGKAHGITIISQSDLNDQAEYAKKVINDLYALMAKGGIVTSQTLASAQIAYIEATARSMHISAQEYAKSIGTDYNELQRRVTDSVRAGNTAWKASISEIGQSLRRLFNDVSGSLGDIVADKLLGTGTSDPISHLTESLRGAYEQLSAYSNPKAALESLVSSIQNAGTQAQANAIAVKYFGAQSGPLLAKELRDGTLAAKDISKAIDGATKSTEAYGATSANATSKVTQLWQRAVRDIVQAITKQLIEQGFKALIDWMFKVGTSSSKMADDVVAAVKKIAEWLKIIKPSSVPTGTTPTGSPIPTIPTIPSTIPTTTPPSTPPTVPDGGGSGGLGSIAGIVNMVSGIVTAVSSVIGNFQMAGMNKSLDIIVKHTLQCANDLANLRVDEWSRYNHIYERMGELISAIREGEANIFTRLGEISLGGAGQVVDYSKYMISMVTSSAQIAAALTSGDSLASAGGGTVITITGPITVQANNAAEFVRDLKRKRIVQNM